MLSPESNSAKTITVAMNLSTSQSATSYNGQIDIIRGKNNMREVNLSLKPSIKVPHTFPLFLALYYLSPKNYKVTELSTSTTINAKKLILGKFL